ncbi:MAG: hypothetical protein K2W85_04725 [Phycisphaerales bacterium]|nr:hypothetical protein [Phycisphaerales bacterium]
MNARRIIRLLTVLATVAAAHMPSCCCWTHAVSDWFARDVMIASGPGEADGCCDDGEPMDRRCPAEHEHDEHDGGGCGCVQKARIACGGGPGVWFGDGLVATAAGGDLGPGDRDRLACVLRDGQGARTLGMGGRDLLRWLCALMV